MIGLITSILPSIFKLGDKLIEDKDKRNEFAFKTQEMAFKMMEVMLNTKTYPWVDALVKLAYASEQIVKGLIRPIGAFVMFAYAAYCDINGIQLNEMIQTTLYGAPFAWGVSRHVEKNRKPKPVDDEDDW
jgi:hypothetical protein